MVSLIYSTMGSFDEAKRIGRKLVEEKLVACVNIVPQVFSIYRWKDAIEEDEEVVLLAKTKDTLIADVIVKIRDLHSYDVPDIVALPINSGLDDYLMYVDKETL